MSSRHNPNAWKFGAVSKPGNCASAPFFLWMAHYFASSTLKFLDRAIRDRPGSVDPKTRADAELLIQHIAADAERALV